MSIPVDVGDLAKALEGFGAGYLLTNRGARSRWSPSSRRSTDGIVLVEGPGKGTVANLADNAAVTLVFPPREPRGFTLLVDGTAESRATTSGSRRPTRCCTGRPATPTVRRRPTAAATTAPRCAHV